MKIGDIVTGGQIRSPAIAYRETGIVMVRHPIARDPDGDAIVLRILQKLGEQRRDRIGLHGGAKSQGHRGERQTGRGFQQITPQPLPFHRSQEKPQGLSVGNSFSGSEITSLEAATS
jgi:hypothetical protein